MFKVFFLLLILIFTSSCETLKKGLGMEKDTPDEFLINKIDPIEMPPNYDLLPPGQKKKKIKKNKTAKEIIDNSIETSKNKAAQKTDRPSSILEQEILSEINKN